MACCSSVCQKWTSFGFSLGFLISGFLMIFCWDNLFNSIMNHQLTLVDGTYQYKSWLDAPIEIYMEMYIFNWTNAKEFQDSGEWVKPKFEELGPYTFSLRISRANVKFNDNKTVSYNTIRTYKFEPDRSEGTLDDPLTVFNPVLMTMSGILKDKNYLVQRGAHYFIKNLDLELVLNTNVGSLSFDGISSAAMDFASRLTFMDGYAVPYDKFGYFYERNGSASYEGDYTIWTGEDNLRKTGIVDQWNHRSDSAAYEGDCSKINGSSGEVYYPVEDDVTFSLFQSDFCGKVTLDRNGSSSVNGMEGNRYISTDKMYDNGNIYPETACFSPGVQLESGLRNLSLCQYHAPAFISLPHFYLGDESLRTDIEGMNPDPEKHELYFVLEPNLGLPLEAHIVFQANMKLSQIDSIDAFKNVDNTTIPMMWIRVNSGVPDIYILLLRFAFAISTIGYIFAAFGVILFAVGVFHDLRKRKGSLSYSDYLRSKFSRNSFKATPLFSRSDSTSVDRKTV